MGNPFPNDKFLNLPNSNSLQTTISNLMKCQKVLQMGKKNSVKKGEIARYEQFLLFPQCFQKQFTSNFFFSHSVFKRLFLQTHKKQGLFEKGLTHYQMTNFRLIQTERVCRQQSQI